MADILDVFGNFDRGKLHIVLEGVIVDDFEMLGKNNAFKRYAIEEKSASEVFCA